MVNTHLSESQSSNQGAQLSLDPPIALIHGQPALSGKEPAITPQQVPHGHMADIPAGGEAPAVMPQVHLPDGAQALRGAEEYKD